MERAEIPSDVDVAVLGLTLGGVTAARLLAQAGRRVLVIDVPGTDGWVRQVPGVATAVRGPLAHQIAVRHGEGAATEFFAGLDEAVRTVANLAAQWGVPHRTLPGWSIAIDGHLAFELRHEARLLRLAALRVDFSDEQPFELPIRPFLVRAQQCEVDVPAFLAAAVKAAGQAGVRFAATSVASVGRIIRTGAGPVRATDVIDAVGLGPTGVGPGVVFERRPSVGTGPLPTPEGAPDTASVWIDSPVELLIRDADGARLIGRPGGSAESLTDWARTHLGAQVRETSTLVTESTADGLPLVGSVLGSAHRWVLRGFGVAPVAQEIWGGTRLAAQLLAGGHSPARPARSTGTVPGLIRSRLGVLADPKQRVAEVLTERGLARAVSARR